MYLVWLLAPVSIGTYSAGIEGGEGGTWCCYSLLGLTVLPIRFVVYYAQATKGML